MSSKQAYMRKFIILDEQNINYSKANSQKPKGHTKIEVRDGKGKITLNVDGLNANVSDEKVYKGYLLSNHDIKPIIVDVGSIILNSSGRGSVEWQFNPASVGGTGVSIESFNVIIVKLSSKNGYDDETIVPLAGYIQEADGSIAMMISKLGKSMDYESNVESNDYQEEKQDEIQEMIVPVESTEAEEPEEIVQTDEIPQPEEIIQQDEIIQTDEQIEEETCEPEQLLDTNQSIDEIIDEIKILDEEHEEDKYYDSNEFKQIEGNVEDYFVDQNDTSELNQEADANNPSIKYNHTVYNDNNYGHSINRANTYIENARNYSRQIANYAMNILKFFDKVNPFKEILEGYQWWEIEYDSKNIYRGFLPFYNYLVNMYYPYPFMAKVTTCQSLIKKYNHYIFGIVEGENEIQYYVYGVPGRFTRDEQPYNGATGFTTWLRNKERGKEDMGYWLIYIDALSGKIVTPLNPTIPPK